MSLLGGASPTRRVIPRQPTLRVYNDTTAVRDAYFHATEVDSTGKAREIYGRSTLTLVKLGGQWVIVSHHISQLPPQ